MNWFIVLLSNWLIVKLLFIQQTEQRWNFQHKYEILHLKQTKAFPAKKTNFISLEDLDFLSKCGFDIEYCSPIAFTQKFVHADVLETTYCYSIEHANAKCPIEHA